jgi:hypothetical protein
LAVLGKRGMGLNTVTAGWMRSSWLKYVGWVTESVGFCLSLSVLVVGRSSSGHGWLTPAVACRWVGDTRRAGDRAASGQSRPETRQRRRRGSPRKPVDGTAPPQDVDDARPLGHPHGLRARPPDNHQPQHGTPLAACRRARAQGPVKDARRAQGRVRPPYAAVQGPLVVPPHAAPKRNLGPGKGRALPEKLLERGQAARRAAGSRGQDAVLFPSREPGHAIRPPAGMSLAPRGEGHPAAAVQVRADGAAPAVHLYAAKKPDRGAQGKPGHAAHAEAAFHGAPAADVQNVGSP